jgi:hypothetical protein
VRHSKIGTGELATGAGDGIWGKISRVAVAGRVRWNRSGLIGRKLKDRRKRPEEGEWEPIKIHLRNFTSILKSIRHPSLLTLLSPHSYETAIGPQNQFRNHNGNTKRC